MAQLFCLFFRISTNFAEIWNDFINGIAFYRIRRLNWRFWVTRICIHHLRHKMQSLFKNTYDIGKRKLWFYAQLTFEIDFRIREIWYWLTALNTELSSFISFNTLIIINCTHDNVVVIFFQMERILEIDTRNSNEHFHAN